MFSALRLLSAVTVLTIVLVSALGMYNTLAMLVMEKTKEIAILRSMGYTRGDITAVFLWLGVVVLALGSVCGCAAGALLTFGLEHMPDPHPGHLLDRPLRRELGLAALRVGNLFGGRRGHDRGDLPLAPRRAPRTGRYHPRNLLLKKRKKSE